MSSIKKLAIRGAVWTIGSYGIAQVLRFGSNLVLTHLLFPRLFGLMSLVYVFITGLHLFSDIGIGPSIIQNKRGNDPKFLNTAWTLQILRSLAIWLCCIAVAFPAATFYNEPQLLWLIPLVGLNTVINGFNSTSLFTLNRELSVREIALFELGGQIVSITVMVVWAYFNKTIWALVMGSLTSAVIQLIWSHKMNPGAPNRLAWDSSATKEIISYGKWIFLSTVLTFLAFQSDRLILGKLFSFELLGVYSIAYSLSDIPKQLTSAVCTKVIFPTYAKFIDLPRDEFRRKIQHNRGRLLVAIAFGLAILVSFGDLVVLALYDPEYAAAGWMLPLLALGIWPLILNTTLDQALFALGNIRFVTYGVFFSFLFLALGIPIGFHFFGIVGAIAAVPFSNVPPYFVITYGLWKEKLACIAQDLKMTALLLLLIAVMVLSRQAFGIGFPLPGSI